MSAGESYQSYLQALRNTTSCETTDYCKAVCYAAGGGTDCSKAWCNSKFGRCDCQEAVLTLHGTCQAGGGQASECEHSVFNVTWTMGVDNAPEMFIEDFKAGVISDQLMTLFELGTAAGAGAEMSQVRISDPWVVLYVGNESLPPDAPNWLSLDAGYVFCANGSSPSGGEFEHGFILEAEKYRVFLLSSIYLLRFEAVSTSTAAPSEAPSGRLSEGKQAEEDTDSPDTGLVILIFMLVLLSVMLIMGSGAWIWRQRQRQKVAGTLDESPQEMPPQRQRVLAHVFCPFSPADVEDDKVFQESCLVLSEGDIVEVAAGGGGWFYGKVVSKSGDDGQGSPKVGYFPENRASWIGSIPGESKASSAEQPLLVVVEHGFSPRDVSEEYMDDNLRQDCLHLEAGELVEVLAGGGGWLYGQVAGDPDRVGYFPENRTTWQGGSPSVEETRTERLLVQVVQGFSPGSPGDAEEEVSFAESCIALAEGDVVEVAASGGGWVYGRVVGDPERVGYFPETRVWWLGRPMPSEAASSQAPLRPVAEDSAEGFSPDLTTEQDTELRMAAEAALQAVASSSDALPA